MGIDFLTIVKPPDSFQVNVVFKFDCFFDSQVKRNFIRIFKAFHNAVVLVVLN